MKGGISWREVVSGLELENQEPNRRRKNRRGGENKGTGVLLETRNKGAGVERVLDQHKCCRERAKLEFLVTQKKREEAGLQPAGKAAS